MTNHSKEARLRKKPLGACHKERKHLHRGKKWHHDRLINKTTFLCLKLGGGGGCRRTNGSRQAHLNQTKVVKGQNSKIWSQQAL